jgi:hypothetical protein
MLGGDKQTLARSLNDKRKKEFYEFSTWLLLGMVAL